MRIKVISGGPYIVSGGIPLIEQIIVHDAEGYSVGWREGKKYPLQAQYALCRCGRSRRKPFCDGAHSQVNFDGTETASRDKYLNQAEVIDGPVLKLTDAPKLCADAGFCTRAGGIWKLIQQKDDPEAQRIAIEEAVYCPAGRLVVWDEKDTAIEPELEPSIGLVEDPYNGVSGPIWVRGCIPVESAEGVTYELRNRVTLCRCGKSTNMPFCDGCHMRAQSEP